MYWDWTLWNKINFSTLRILKIGYEAIFLNLYDDENIPIIIIFVEEDVEGKPGVLSVGIFGMNEYRNNELVSYCTIQYEHG